MSYPYSCLSADHPDRQFRAAEETAFGGARKEESHLGLVRRARRMNRELAVAFPHVYCELDFTTPLELAVATILSAQCTDVRVNMVTPALFARYPDAKAYAEADRTELESTSAPPASTGTRRRR
ncbi:hypothetical protein GCM10020255_046560 [Rhodococcus baikonurensis]